MMNTISQFERSDILLALARAFEKDFSETENPASRSSARELVERWRGALAAEDLEFIRERAELIDSLTEENRENWQHTRLVKIRRRGRAERLDENVNPSHIVRVLEREPKLVQDLILKNLPPDLSRRISLYLDLNFLPGENSNDKNISDAIVALVRTRFLSNFIALEDVYEPDELDGFTIEEVENFIRQLGLREVAIACRGINSKEALAAFLNRFDEEDAREIAVYITELEKIRPSWVAQADELVRKSWSADLTPSKVIRKIGFKLLAAAFVFRDETKCDYTGQKLPIREVKNWQRLVNLAKRKFSAATEEEKPRLDNRRRVVERLAVKFKQTGKL